MGLTETTSRFCTGCGTALVDRMFDHRIRQVCPSCGRVQWRNAKPTAGALVLRNGKVLLVRRAIEPFLGYWDIPGGFCEADEHPTTTAIRETREETGLEVELTGLLGLWLDKYAGLDTLNIYYLARPATQTLRLGSESTGAAWFAPTALPQRIAFANGIAALEAWVSGCCTPPHLRGSPWLARRAKRSEQEV